MTTFNDAPITECGYIGTNELDDYCPTVRILRGWPL